jgi:hypothetical protein
LDQVEDLNDLEKTVEPNLDPDDNLETNDEFCDLNKCDILGRNDDFNSTTLEFKNLVEVAQQDLEIAFPLDNEVK